MDIAVSFPILKVYPLDAPPPTLRRTRIAGELIEEFLAMKDASEKSFVHVEAKRR